MSSPRPGPSELELAQDALRLEAVTVSVGFDDLLDATLEANHPHLDHAIVVTSHDDQKTAGVARKHGATLVPTDLFSKHGRHFNKGAALNAGLNYFRFHGWRLHLDADVALPDNFRRVLFNHTHLEASCLYGADRVDVVGREALERALAARQHDRALFVEAGRPHGARFVDHLDGYLPLGYFQLWHASCQKPYPHSLGTAAHDDTMFAALWPSSRRRLLPSTIVYHLVSRPPVLGENWEGKRRQPRLA